MGDTGSMILGFIIAVFSVRFISNSELLPNTIYHNSSPMIVLAFLFFPLLDTLRIFFIRLVVFRKSPFSADRNHLHHRFLGLGFSHIQTTAIIVLVNISLIASTFWFRNYEIHLQLIILLVLGTILYSLYFIYDRLTTSRQKITS